MEKFFEKFIRALIDRPLLVNLLLIFIVITGIYSMMNIQRLGFPRIDLNILEIYTTYPGASPEDVELNVTKKIEEAIEGVSDIKEYSSVSLENLSVVNVVIDESAEDKEKVKDDIEEAINRITDFPEEVKTRPSIFEEKSDSWAIMTIGFSTGISNPAKCAELAKSLKDDLIELSSVSGVSIQGVYENEVAIKLKKNLLEQYTISFEEVIGAIKNNKIRLSAGSLESYTTETGIVTLSEFSNEEEIRNIIVRINDAGNFIRIGDIADVSLQLKESDVIRKINGKYGIWLNVTKQGNADIIDSVKQINHAIDRFKNSGKIDAGTEILILSDMSIDTRNRLNILYSNAAVGLVLVLAILFLFFNTRLAFWTAMGIPVAFSAAFIVAALAGVSINRISLLGLVVVLGMLVDDSIVVAENIYRHRKEGLDPKDAAARGTAQVLVPVLGTVATTVIAFLPMYFIPGMAFDFSREVPTFVIAMLVGSLIEAVFALPVHLSHSKKIEKRKISQPIGSPFLQYCERVYGAFLKKMLRHRYLSFGAICGIFITALFLSSLMVRFVMFPIDQSTTLLLYGETKADSKLKNTEAVIAPIDEIIDSLPEGVVRAYVSLAGRKHRYSMQTLPSYFSYEITLTPSTERKMTALEVKNYIFDEIQKRGLKGIESIDYEIDGGGPPAGKPVSIDVIGNDNTKRVALIKTISEDLKLIGLTEVESTYREGKSELRLTPDYQLIAKGALSVSQIAGVIRTAFDGTEVAYMETADERIPFRVVLDKEGINAEQPLDGLYTINNRGIVIPVENLLRKEMTVSAQSIFRHNGKRKNTITANLPEKMTAAQVYAILSEKYRSFEKVNPGFRINLGGEAEQSNLTFQRMIFAIVLALLGVYFVLVLQFGSLIQPAIVISAVPFGLIGILFAFGIQRLDLSMLALVGIMGYGGVVVNNSLILVEFMNNERKRNSGADFIDNIVAGSRSRLTPIFLTTVTTVVGLVPTAYGWFGGVDSFISPMIMAMAWGLIIGTPAVLFIIPIQYAIIEDIRRLFIGFFGRADSGIRRNL